MGLRTVKQERKNVKFAQVFIIKIHIWRDENERQEGKEG